MVEIKSVLCPVDFSDFSRHALAHAIVLARWYGARLTVFHAYPHPVEPPPVLYGGFPGMLPLDSLPRMTASPRQVHDDAIADVKRFCDATGTQGLDVRYEARPGSIVANILEEAATLNADLIVLGTHGRSGFGHLVIGSVAEHVLRKASCAVLTVPPLVAQPPGDPLVIFKRILCPVDFSEASLKALAYGLSLAKEADAELVMLHVVEDTPGYLRPGAHGTIARMTAMMPADARTWCSPDVLLGAGKPFQEILRTATERDIHVIVMGVHRRNLVDLMFTGSTTYQVIRAAACPVLTLKE
jgi:nucleotide-binding universal stress UspA family protein